MLNALIAIWSFFAGYGLICFLEDHSIIEQIKNNANKVSSHFKETFQQFLDWWNVITRNNNVGTCNDYIDYFPEIKKNDSEMILITPAPGDSTLEGGCVEDIITINKEDIEYASLVVNFPNSVAIIQSLMNIPVMFAPRDVLYTPTGMLFGYQKNIFQRLLESFVPEKTPKFSQQKLLPEVNSVSENTVTLMAVETPKFPQQPTLNELQAMSVRALQRFIDSINQIKKGSIKRYRTKGVNKKGLIRKINEFYAHC